MRYALIQEGKVENFIWLSPSNAGDFPSAVYADGVPVKPGDTYADGAFYRNGERVLSQAEETAMLLNELMGGVEDVRYE